MTPSAAYAGRYWTDGVPGLLHLLFGKANMPTESVRNRVSEKSRADLLAEIADATLGHHTAGSCIYRFYSRRLFNWRSQRRRPRYHGKNEFIRYRIADLDLRMSSRADEIRPEDPVDLAQSVDWPAVVAGAGMSAPPTSVEAPDRLDRCSCRRRT